MTENKILPIWTEEINRDIETAVSQVLEKYYEMYEIKFGDISPLQNEAWNNHVTELTEIFQQLITQNFDGEVKVLGEGETDICKRCGKVEVDNADNYVKCIGKVCCKCYFEI